MQTIVFATDTRTATSEALRRTARSLRRVRRSQRAWYRGDSGDDPRAEWVVFIAAGDKITLDTVHVIDHAGEAVDLIYGDTRHDIPRPDRLPTFQRRPSFSPERLRSHDYIGDFVIARRRVVDAAGGLADLVTTTSHDRNLRLTEHAANVVRVPSILNVTRSTNLLPSADAGAVERHIQRCGVNATVELDERTPLVRVRRRLTRRPLVSVIIPTRGSSTTIRGAETPLVVNTVRTLLERSTYDNLEFVVVADTPTPNDVRSELTRIGGERLTIVDYDQAFNFAVKNNIGVAHSTGEYVLLLNDDTEIITPDALETMLALFEDDNVGIVGPMLYFEDGSIQSAGHVFTPDPTDMYRLQPADTRGAHNYVRVQREVSSVIAACLLTSREIFEEVGGLSTQFPGNWNDVDFALKVRQAGYSVIFTPYASFFHFESKTRVALRIEAEVAKLGHRWGDILDDDPFFNPRLQRFTNLWRADLHTDRSYEDALGPTAPMASK